MCEDFDLEDPVVKRLEGRFKAIEAMENIFASCHHLDFRAKNIYLVKPNTTIIEFSLQLDNTHLQGVDIIEWKNNKLKEIRAYLDIPK